MIFEYHKINTQLNANIESIFYFKDFQPGHSIERVVPTGNVFILFELDGMKRYIFDNESLERIAEFSNVWVSGIHKNYISISAHENSEMLVVQFKAYGAYPFLHLPVHQLNDKVVNAVEIFGDSILDLRGRILEDATIQGKFEKLENWLIERANARKNAPEYFSAFVEKLNEVSANKLNEMIKSYPRTQKQLIQQFKRYVGVTPKYFHRLLRFNDIIKIIQKKESISWAEVASVCNYSDQSHFIKEFHFFSGYNPVQFLKKEFEDGMTNFFPLDKKG